MRDTTGAGADPGRWSGGPGERGGGAHPGFVGIGVVEVAVAVDGAGEDVFAGGVDVVVGRGKVGLGPDADDLLAGDGDGGREGAGAGDDGAAAHDGVDSIHARITPAVRTPRGYPPHCIDGRRGRRDRGMIGARGTGRGRGEVPADRGHGRVTGESGAPAAEWPVEYTDQLHLGDPESEVAICCLWSRRDGIRDGLRDAEYAAIGQLYSRAGIGALLRNILAKPTIRYLVLAGQSLTDSDTALLDFFHEGVDADWRIKGNGGEIDPDLPLAALEDVREYVSLIDLRAAPDFVPAFREAVAGLERRGPFADRREFPRSVRESETFPSEFMGFVVRNRTMLEVWREAIGTIMRFGGVSPTEFGVEQKEVLGLMSVVEDPAAEPGAVPDWAPFDEGDLAGYVERFFESGETEGVAYNYGHRLQARWDADQIDLMVAEIRRVGASRRAVASLWDPVADSRIGEPPCIVTIQTALRQGRVHLMAYVRSNDMFRAFPLNVAALQKLQLRVTEGLEGAAVGPLGVLSFSAHIYSDCWEASARAAEEGDRRRDAFRPDPRGNMTFRLDGERLRADHYSPQGDLVQSLAAESARELRHQVDPFAVLPGHAMYLGSEIERLAAARESGEGYDQERV